MSTIQSSAEHLTLNADGSSKDIKFQANGVEKASISSAGVISSDGGSTHADNVKARFGTGNDLEIYHDGSHSRIMDAGTGNMTLGSSQVNIVNAANNADQATFTDGGSCAFYHNGNKKIETTATGATVTGYLNVSQTGNASGLQVATSVAAETTAIFQGGGTGGVDVVDIRDSGGNSKFKVRQNGGIGINYTAPSGGQIYVNKKELVLNVTPSGTAIVMSPDSASAFEAIDFRNSSGSQIGSIACSTTATAYNTSSDYRLKENVDYTWDATTRLKQLKPARFNFIADDTNTLVDGFIAHEVSSVVPEAISGEKDAMTAEVLYVEGDDIPEGKSIGDVKTAAAIDPQGIDQSKLVPLLVKTIQELEARITALEA